MGRKIRTPYKHKIENYIGLKFGRLTCLSFSRKDEKSLVAYANFRCDCGRFKEIILRAVIKGYTKSCGCLSIEKSKDRLENNGNRLGRKHGESRTNLCSIWRGIINRCKNPKLKCYHNYGGRGIKMCKKWEDNFLAFKEDMGERPSKNHTVERINNDGDYEPSNCRWATRQEQLMNKRTNIWLTVDGAKILKTHFLKKYNINRESFDRAIKKGMTYKDIISKYSKPYKNKKK